jgi:WxcM-like, C-terminal
MNGRLHKARMIALELFAGDRGKLRALNAEEMPFAPTRMFYISDVPRAAERGGHAHLHTEQLLIALTGAVTVSLQDGEAIRNFRLNDPGIGLYIPRMIWDKLYDFKEGTTILALASWRYEEHDYIRDWPEFRKLAAIR